METITIGNLVDVLLEQPIALRDLIRHYDLPKTKCNVVFP